MKHFKKISILLFLILSSLYIESCKKSDNPIEPEFDSRGDLLSVTELKEFSVQELTQLAIEYKYTLPITFPIKAYKVRYLTIDNDNNYVVASGLILMPQKSGPMAIICAQHGTQFTKSGGAVSDLGGSYVEALVPAAFGYAVMMPDYLGFGASSTMFHPYHHAKLTANAAIDMIRAGKNFFKTLSTVFSDKLFLMGYSEGGFATMATFKEIEENYSDEFKITAVAPGAGAFNLAETAKSMINAQRIDYPGYLPYVLLTYLKYYKLSYSLSDIFKEPYAGRIPGLFDGTKGSTEINNNLSYVPAELLKPEFISGFNGSSYQDLKNAILQNNTYNWKPKSPVRLFHGPKDRQVPYFNSQNAYDAMKSLGADIEFITCTVGSQDHEETAIYWFIDTMVWFGKML